MEKLQVSTKKNSFDNMNVDDLLFGDGLVDFSDWVDQFAPLLNGQCDAFFAGHIFAVLVVEFADVNQHFAFEFADADLFVFAQIDFATILVFAYL